MTKSNKRKADTDMQVDECKRSKKEKFYAVKAGRSIGIFESSDEFNASVHGYKGSVCKRFKRKEDALAWLSTTSTTTSTTTTIITTTATNATTTTDAVATTTTAATTTQSNTRSIKPKRKTITKQRNGQQSKESNSDMMNHMITNSIDFEFNGIIDYEYESGTTVKDFHWKRLGKLHYQGSKDLLTNNITIVSIRGELQSTDIYDETDDRFNPSQCITNVHIENELNETDGEKVYFDTASGEFLNSMRDQALQVALLDAEKISILLS